MDKNSSVYRWWQSQRPQSRKGIKYALFFSIPGWILALLPLIVYEATGYGNIAKWDVFFLSFISISLFFFYSIYPIIAPIHKLAWKVVVSFSGALLVCFPLFVSTYYYQEFLRPVVPHPIKFPIAFWLSIFIEGIIAIASIIWILKSERKASI